MDKTILDTTKIITLFNKMNKYNSYLFERFDNMIFICSLLILGLTLLICYMYNIIIELQTKVNDMYYNVSYKMKEDDSETDSECDADDEKPTTTESDTEIFSNEPLEKPRFSEDLSIDEISSDSNTISEESTDSETSDSETKPFSKKTKLKVDSYLLNKLDEDTQIVITKGSNGRFIQSLISKYRNIDVEDIKESIGNLTPEELENVFKRIMKFNCVILYWCFKKQFEEENFKVDNIDWKHIVSNFNNNPEWKSYFELGLTDMITVFYQENK